MNTPLHQTRIRSIAGFTLIEVLITVVVMALGLLGIAALQTVALKSGRTALHRSYATFYAYDIVDSMRANRPAAVAGNYDLAINAAAPTCGTIVYNCDLRAWRDALARDLPDGTGSVDVDASGSATIQIRWSEGVNTDRTLTFRTQTTL